MTTTIGASLTQALTSEAVRGFAAKGISPVSPQDILSYVGWMGRGRHVRRGERGVSVLGETVFHISQTQPNTITVRKSDA